MLELLTNVGPITAAVNAANWQQYVDGIIEHDSDPKLLNHAVQIVGFDRSGPIPYYIVRNSWGTKYGQHGYLKIKIGNNVCGIANQVSAVDVL